MKKPLAPHRASGGRSCVFVRPRETLRQNGRRSLAGSGPGVKCSPTQEARATLLRQAEKQVTKLSNQFAADAKLYVNSGDTGTNQVAVEAAPNMAFQARLLT